jgi:hypothetical protein
MPGGGTSLRPGRAYPRLKRAQDEVVERDSDAHLVRRARSRHNPSMRVSSGAILTPDQRLRVFVSSTLGELAEERAAVRRAIESLGLTAVMFELGARPHPPRSLYQAYLEQSHVFVGIYWQRYGWVVPRMEISGLEDEYALSADLPRLV